jgi:hypothetical protein
VNTVVPLGDKFGMDMHGGGGGAMPMSAEAAIGAGGMGNNCDDLYEMVRP